MPVVLVQKKDGVGTNITFTSNTVAGNLIIVAAVIIDTTTTCGTGSVTDTQSNTYTQVVTASQAGGSNCFSAWIFWATSGSSAADTVTISYTGTRAGASGTTLYEEFKEEYGYDKWWLRPEEFMTEVRESDSRPLFKRFLFDDHGQLEEQGKFFTYSDDVKAKIREGIRVLDYMIMKKKAKALNFTNNKIMEKAIYAGMVGIVNASKFLYHINPKLELKVIQPIHYALRRSRIYRDVQYS